MEYILAIVAWGGVLLFVIMNFVMNKSTKRLKDTIDYSKRVQEEYQKIVQGVVDWENGVRYSVDYIHSVADAMEDDEKMGTYAPLIRSVAENLYTAAALVEEKESEEE